MQTAGPWSPEEKQWHINCLKALAAFYAVKCSVRDRKNITALLRMDNTTVVAYVNSVSRIEHHSQGSMALVHELGYHSGGRTSTWSPQGYIRICIQTDNSAEEVLHLETRSRGRSSGCLQPEL